MAGSLRKVNQSTCIWNEAEDWRFTYKLNIKVCWLNHCCHVKAISTVYSEFVFVVIVCQYVKHMRPLTFVICGLSGSTIFFHIIS